MEKQLKITVDGKDIVLKGIIRPSDYDDIAVTTTLNKMEPFEMSFAPITPFYSKIKIPRKLKKALKKDIRNLRKVKTRFLVHGAILRVNGIEYELQRQ